MKVELKNALPQYFTDIYEVDAILKAVSNEIGRLYDVMERAFNNLAANKAQGALERWEKDLGLSSYGTIDERRSAILAKLGLMRTQTVDTVRSLIRAYRPNIMEKIVENGRTVSISVSEEGQFGSFRQLLAQIRNALPFHLDVEFEANSSLDTVLMKRKEMLCTMDMEIETGG